MIVLLAPPFTDKEAGAQDGWEEERGSHLGFLEP